MELEPELEPPNGNQLPPEVLEIILSKLEKSDLLTSRLVCHLWNEECGKLFGKPDSKFTQTLTDTNIAAYINFISSPDCFPQVVLPFHLKFSTVDTNPRPDRVSDKYYKIVLDNLTERVETLCAFFGDHCIAKLSLTTAVPSGKNVNTTLSAKLWLLNFLMKVAPGLEILDLTYFQLNYTEDDFKFCDVTFPKLKTLTCYESGDRPVTVNHIYQYIIENSPNLEHLRHIDAWNLAACTLFYNKLKTLRIGKINGHSSDILNKFQQSNPSVLQNLSFTLDHSLRYDETDGVRNILQFVSSTLKSLTFTVTDSLRGRGTTEERLLTFPKLTTLRHLRIDYEIDDFVLCNPEEMNFNPVTLPSLRSVELPLGLIFCDERSFKTSLMNGIEYPVVFPRVSELTIRLTSDCWFDWSPDIQDYKGVLALKHLQRVIPNICKFSIINESFHPNSEPGSTVKHLLKYLVQSPLSRNIEEIVIDGFAEDSFCNALDEMGRTGRQNLSPMSWRNNCQLGPDNHFFFSNIRVIKFRLSDVTLRGWWSASSHENLVPNLSAMAKCLPVLQTIEISEVLYPGIREKERIEFIQNLESIYPYLHVRVVKD